MVASYDSRIVFNANYHPQANPTERVNRVIKTMIRSFVNKNHRSWDEQLHKYGFAIRTAVHEVTGFSPAYLNFGRELYLSGKVHSKFGQESDEAEIQFGNRKDFAHHMRELQEMFATVRARLDKSYEQSATRYNLRKRPLELEKNQIVWKKNYCLSDGAAYFASKLAPKFTKCQVIEKVSANVYRLKDFETGKVVGNWLIKDLKTDTN
ncbi:hypothetical protein JTB14_007626 [Gonioctena quinquepunctata]|nr:hypothetical protein JTB14_007626 [Gonioctena quinquepunctata]